MATLPVYDKTGAEVGKYEIDPSEIAEKINKQLMHDAVVMYQANARQGSAKSKSRAEIAASTKKMYRQKGTGHARAGHRSSGVRRGGGHIFAKRPRDFSYRLASKIGDEKIKLIDELQFSQPKTKDMAAILEALKINSTLLIAIADHDANVYKSARNLPGVTIMPVLDVNAYELLKPKCVLMTKAAMDVFREKK